MVGHACSCTVQCIKYFFFFIQSKSTTSEHDDVYARTHIITLQTPNYVYYYIALLLLLQRVVVASRSKLYNAVSVPRVLQNVRAGGGRRVYNFFSLSLGRRPQTNV